MATGHIRKRINKNGSISYQVIAEGEHDPLTGKRERRYKTVNGTKKEAEAVRRKMIADLENGNISAPSAIKLRDWMHKWLNTYLPNIEETTRAGYKEKIDGYIIPELGNIQLKALKADNVQAWVNGLTKRGLAPKTVRNAYNNLNAALKKAVILRMIPYNPCYGVELPKAKKYRGKVYDKSGIHAALRAAEGTDMYLPVLLLLSAGLRRGELAALRWENVDFEKNTLHICENRVHGVGEVITKAPKSAAGNRKITVSSDVMAVLAKAKLDYFNEKAAFGSGFCDLGYVIHNTDGKPYHPDSLTKKWARFVETNGLEYIRLHDLRHTNATAMMQAGVNAKVVSERLGHADVKITLDTYTHVLPTMDEDAAGKLDSIIFDKAGNG